MPKQFEIYFLRKSYVERVVTFAWFPTEFEDIATPWMPVIETPTPFSWNVDSFD